MDAVFLFVLGTAVGSFLNVVGLRWGQESFGGRSKCPQCSKVLSWYELVPIASFFLQKGRCRSCGARISWQYPIIEIFTGLIFVTVPVWMLPVFCIYIAILIYDSHHKIIPDPLVYTAIALSFFYSLFLTPYFWQSLLAGSLIFAFFGSIWLLSRGRAMGFGDAKLGLSVGLLLGAAQGFSAIVLAFWIGAAVSVSYILLGKTGFLNNGKRLTIKSEVPFAPFIILGAWLSLILQLDILNVLYF